MKKIFLFLAGVITIPFFVYHGNQSLKENQLTNLKDEIYKSIDSIDKIILDCMSCDGKTILTEENKLDFAVRYIIENKSEFIKDINIYNKEDYYTYEDTLYYNFGKVTEQFAINIINKFFYSFDFNIKNYKFYNNGYIELNFEPIEHLWYDSKKILNVEKINNKVYNVYMEYNREINGKIHTFNVKYIVNYDNDIKFENIHIYNSIVSDENENKN